MSPEHEELILRLKTLADNWDSLAAATRELADKEGASHYTKGYGYGSAETLTDNAAKIRLLIVLEEK
jgi:hypothetical protein